MIPLYNAEPFLAQTIESVLGETHPPQQVITDRSAQIARRTGAAVQLVQQPNAGGACARNRGVALAHGDLLAFLDDEDYWMPEKLAWQLDALRQSPHLEAIFGQIRSLAKATTAGQGERWFGMTATDGWHIDTLLIRRQAFQRIGRFAPAWMIDTVEWLWRARRLRLCTQVLPQVLAWRRIHGDNHSIRARSRAHQQDSV